MLDTGSTSEINEYHFLGYRLDVRKRCLYDPQKKPVHLSSRALDTLQLLVMHAGEILSKSFLVENVWPDSYVEENNLNQAITSIRKALGDSKLDSRFIKTVTGRGYCFIAELDAQEAVSDTDLATESTPEPPLETTPDADSPGLTKNPTDRRQLYLQATTALVVMVVFGFIVKTLFFNSSQTTPLASSTSNFSQALDIQALQDAEIIPNSLAILPLINLTPSENPDNKIFALGLHDELIHQLSKVRNLNLVSRESVLTPAIQKLSLSEVGKLLRVESVITGTILFVESQARINLQMLNPETGLITWTFAYDVNTSSFRDLIFAQNDIATRVKEELRTDLANEDLQQQIDWPTESYEAYRYNVAATHASYEGLYSKTWALSKKALALDPNYLNALYNYSKANTILASAPLAGMTTQEHLHLAFESAERIIELAPENHEGYVIKAVVSGNQRQWDSAMLQMKTIDELSAPLWDMQLLVKVLLSVGDFHGAITLLEANLKVEPVDRYARGFLMAAYEMAGDRMKSRQEYDTGEELNPAWWGDMVNVLLALGRNELIVDINELNESRATDNIKKMLSSINEGNYSELPENLLQELHQGTTPYGKLIYHAAIAAYIGNHDMSITFMKQATDELATNFLWFWLPVFHDIRQGAAFKQLLEEAGLVSFWRKHGWPDICKPTDDSFICN